MNERIQIRDGNAEVVFSRYDLDAYALFLKAKTLPESRITYDWRGDSYTLSTPARFAALLGVSKDSAFRTPHSALSSYLWDYQRFIVKAALEAKRYAMYADCGLGKTPMFLEWSKHVMERTGGKVLILSPLQVIEQTREESVKFYGDRLPILHLHTRYDLEVWLDLEGTATRLAITNYEKLIPGVIPSLRKLAGLVCDESSILKGGGGVIKWNLIKSAKGIEYKLSSTATPAPNEIMEYASQAGFLERIRSESEVLWTFFSRDKRGVWRIKAHALAGFYRLLASWSIYLRNPVTYGWADNLSSIPAPVVQEYRLEMTPEQGAASQRIFHAAGAGLFGHKAMGVAQRSKLSQLAKGFVYRSAECGMRSAECRVERIPSRKPDEVVRLIVDEVSRWNQVLVWTVFDEESRILAERLRDFNPDQVAVLDGSMPQSKRLEILESFRHGTLAVLISKPALLGFGMNFQFCGAMIFSGWDDSYERWYQAIRRAYRYGQTKALRIHVPYIAELEGMILDNVLRKKANFERDAETQERYYLEALKGLVKSEELKVESEKEPG